MWGLYFVCYYGISVGLLIGVILFTSYPIILSTLQQNLKFLAATEIAELDKNAGKQEGGDENGSVSPDDEDRRSEVSTPASMDSSALASNGQYRRKMAEGK